MRDNRFLLWGLTKSTIIVILLSWIGCHYLFDNIGAVSGLLLHISNKDLFAGFSIHEIEMALIMVFGIICVLDSVNLKTTGLYLFILKNYSFCVGTVILIGVFSYYSAHGVIEYCCVNYLFLFLVRVERFKKIELRVSSINATNIWSEFPICDEEKLTNRQLEVMHELESFTNKCNSHQGLTIVLEGNWGTGKTSLINTYIQRNENDFFVLRINAQIVGSISDITRYIADYIEDLFIKYAVTTHIDFYEFFSALLGDVTDNNIISSLLKNNIIRGAFIDKELEIEYLTQNISLLLKRANKKSILLIIDDADRAELKEPIVKALNQYSLVKGISSILVVNSLANIITNYEDKAYWTKYITTTTSLDNGKNSAREMSIREYILNQNERITHECSDDNYVYTRNFENRTIFSKVEILPYKNDYDNWYMDTKKPTVLLELFTRKFVEEKISFGDFILALLKKYLTDAKNGEELFSLINTKELGTKWLYEIGAISQNIFMNMIEIANILDRLEKEKNPKIVINDYKELHMYNCMLTMPVVWEPNCKYAQAVVNPEYDALETLLLDEQEINIINQLIKKKEYGKAYELFIAKLKLASNFFYSMELMTSFWSFINDELSNIRGVKQHLLNAEKKNKLFIDYIIGEWENDGSANKLETNINQINPMIPELGIQWRPFRYFFDNIIYCCFVDKMHFETGKRIKYDLSTDVIVEVSE